MNEPSCTVVWLQMRSRWPNPCCSLEYTSHPSGVPAAAAASHHRLPCECRSCSLRCCAELYRLRRMEISADMLCEWGIANNHNVEAAGNWQKRGSVGEPSAVQPAAVHLAGSNGQWSRQAALQWMLSLTLRSRPGCSLGAGSQPAHLERQAHAGVMPLPGRLWQ